MSQGVRLFVFVLFAWAASAVADERIRPANPQQLEAAKSQAVKVKGARVSFANFDAIRRDFPVLRSASNEQIESWILDNFAYINKQQLDLNGIRNSEIPLEAEKTKADYRPSGYGRAGVLEGTYDGKAVGLVDIKGLGHGSKLGTQGQVAAFKEAAGDAKRIDALRTEHHSDGLMRHGEAIAELTRQTAVQRLYDLYNHQNGTDYQTVESYFVIELPFDVLGPNGQRDRAALYGRQAHWRGFEKPDSPEHMYEDPKGGKQSTIFRSSVDFGGVMLGKNKLLAEKFGSKPDAKPGDPQDSFPWIWGHQTAKAFADGDPKAVYRHLAEMLESLDADWRALPASSRLHNGPQKSALDLLTIAHGKPGPHQTERLIEALQTLGKEFDDSRYLAARVVSEMSPAAIASVFAKAANLQDMPWELMASGYPVTVDADKDPALNALVESLAAAASDRTSNLAHRRIAAAFLRALVKDRFSTEHAAKVVQPMEESLALDLMAAYKKAFWRSTRRDLLDEIAKTGVQPPGYQEALVREGRAQPGEDCRTQWGFVRALKSLFGKSMSRQ